MLLPLIYTKLFQRPNRQQISIISTEANTGTFSGRERSLVFPVMCYQTRQCVLSGLIKNDYVVNLPLQ